MVHGLSLYMLVWIAVAVWIVAAQHQAALRLEDALDEPLITPAKNVDVAVLDDARGRPEVYDAGSPVQDCWTHAIAMGDGCPAELRVKFPTIEPDCRQANIRISNGWLI